MNNFKITTFFLLFTLSLSLPFVVQAQSNQDLQALKNKILLINQELTALEKELLYPNTEIALYLSVDVGTGIRLNDVLILIDEQQVASYTYDEREYAALVQGGIDRVYTGDIESGPHKITTKIRGINPNGIRYESEQSYSFTKGEKPAYVEIKAADDNTRGKHTVQYLDWK